MNAVYHRPVMPISPDAFVVNAIIHNLTRDEILGYMRLLWAFWCRGGPIPDDDRVANIIQCTPARWRNKTRLKFDGLFEYKDGMLRNDELESKLKEVAMKQDLKRKHQAAGFKSAETKGPDEFSRAAKMAAWSRKHGKDNPANPYSKANASKSRA
jgi:uncharacterized protein YdaU (DUF1376 family)